MNKIKILLMFLVLQSIVLAEIKPPYTDYCEMLARDIQGIQHGFLAGRHMYYCGGKTSAEWDVIENETIGFTHPMFRDGRARGHGIITDTYGTGHDKWGWEFWRKTRVAYGSVIVNGKRYANPVPKRMIWRPDRQICEYELDDVTIKEVKFISVDDVLCDIIQSSHPISVEFKGQSFYNKEGIGTFDGDSLKPFSQNSTAKAYYNKDVNAIQITEGGTIIVKPNWGEKAVEGKLMYDGMNVTLAASQDISSLLQLKQQDQGYWKYSFTLDCEPDKPLVLAFAMGDEQGEVSNRVTTLLASPEKHLEDKTAWFNSLLNDQIPYFRCSDDNVIKTYYYLWSLYFMYFTDADGWEEYPHTQTAINNFMGLHAWDSWVYSLVGSWVVDKDDWAHGNVLSWKHMVQFKNRNNALPDNFGKAWYSPAWMGIELVVENAWKQYLQSGDMAFLKTAYDELFVPLYFDKGPRFGYGINLIALDTLILMAQELDRDNDVKHWQAMRPDMVKRFQAGWESKHPAYYGGGTFRDIWNLAALMSPEMKTQWADRLVKTWIMNTETGFWGPVTLDIRPPDEIENAVFAVSTISTWLVAEGMFRNHCDAEAVYCTLGHLNGMVKDFGFPVAPECWDPDYKPWGSMYYNWDGAMVPLIIGRLAGITWSVPEKTFKVSDHLPETWDYVHTFTPIKQGQEIKWCEVKVNRIQNGPNVTKNITIKGCPLENIVLEPWLENRELMKSAPLVSEGKISQRGHGLYRFNTANAELSLDLGKRTKSIPLLVRVTPFERTFVDDITINVAPMIAGSHVRYTTDGSEPTETSKLYQGPLNFNHNATLKVRAFRQGDTPGPTVTAELIKAKLSESTKLSAPQQGLQYEYYEGKWKKLPDFDSLKIIVNGVVKDFDFSCAKRPEHFAIRYKAYLDVPEDGIYYFNLKSNDSSQLYIDQQLVVDMNIGTMGRDPWDKTGFIVLKKGFHPITVLYHQAKTVKHLNISWGRDKNKMQKIDPSSLFYSSPN
ncbi:MAG: chitobiase/beta-hexosaminidase C-terminal domain-containing protein [Phycisphaerae bacterium]|nr:chitobiase/beta-hexosaminidase C-terminal domain-containing protein [Phycisphaerae bacterium]